MTAFLAGTLFPFFLVMAGAGDALSMRIPNRLNLLIVVAFFPMAFAADMPLQMLALHVSAGIVLLIVGYMLFAFRVFGGGDAKLLAAAGLWLGYPATQSFLVFTALAGGGLALTVGLWSLLKLDSEISGGFIARKLNSLNPNLPYGLALAVGGILAFSQSWWMSVALR